MSALRVALDAAARDPRQLAFIRAWRPPQPLWRVYSQAFGPVGFNASDRGFARFSPLRRPDGTIVPVLYAAQSLDVALMETVFRDVPSPSHGHILTMTPAAREQRRVTRVTLDRPVGMVDFSSIGLRRVGLERAEVIDCDSARYEHTQALAAWVYANTAETVQGIVWTSRQDDSGQAAVLFEDRLAVSGAALAAREAGQHLHAGPPLAAMTRLAERLGVLLLFS